MASSLASLAVSITQDTCGAVAAGIEERASFAAKRFAEGTSVLSSKELPLAFVWHFRVFFLSHPAEDRLTSKQEYSRGSLAGKDAS